MLKMNLKIFLVHIGCCVFGILSLCFLFVLQEMDHFMGWMMLHTISMFVIIASYVAAGFWANNGSTKGVVPVLSIFWLSAVLWMMSLPVIINGFDLKEGGTAEALLLPNISFTRIMLIDRDWIWRFFSCLPRYITYSILAFLSSTLAAAGFGLKSKFRKRTKEIS